MNRTADDKKGLGEWKGFFAIDQRTFAKVCELGRNAATAYLVQACGTGRDNRTTAWSVKSVGHL